MFLNIYCLLFLMRSTIHQTSIRLEEDLNSCTIGRGVKTYLPLSHISPTGGGGSERGRTREEDVSERTTTLRSTLREPTAPCCSPLSSPPSPLSPLSSPSPLSPLSPRLKRWSHGAPQPCWHDGRERGLRFSTPPPTPPPSSIPH